MAATPEERIDAVRRLAAGETTVKALMSRFRVSETAIYQWRRKLGGVAAKADTSAKPERVKAKARKKREPKLEQPAAEEEIDVYAVCDSWSLPYTLGQIVHSVYVLATEDCFDTLAGIEAATAALRAQMEARA